MDRRSGAANVGLSTAMERLFQSSVRFSAAASLYSFYRLECAVGSFQDGDGLGKQMERLSATVDSLTQCLLKEVTPAKRDAVESFSGITERIVRQSVEGMTLLDPRQAMQVASDLAKTSASALSGLAAGPKPAPAESPRLAADVLGS